MRLLSRFLFCALLLAQLQHPAAESVPPESASQASALQIGFFYPSYNATVTGEQAEFVVQIRSFTNTVTPFSASIYIYDSKGRTATVLGYANATIAGGETQVLSKFWDTAGQPIGDYRAFSNATYDGSFTNTKSAQFSIVYSLPSSGNNNTAPQDGSGQEPGENSSSAQPCAEFQCSGWGACSDGYRSQDCIQSPGCSKPDFVHVERCNQGQPPGLPLEQQVCAAFPQTCTTEPQNAAYLCGCLPALVVPLLFFIVLRARQKHLRF